MNDFLYFIKDFWFLIAAAVSAVIFAYDAKTKAERALKLSQKNDEEIEALNLGQKKIETDLAWIKTTLTEIKEKLK
jgi:peptidoglycan hydrolase CwlO-like protein